MQLTKHSEGVDEVAVFETRRGTWVVKEFVGLGVGSGSEIDHEPTDEEIQEVFGLDVNIVRGYALVSTEAAEMIGQRIREANWSPDPRVITSILSRATGEEDKCP